VFSTGVDIGLRAPKYLAVVHFSIAGAPHIEMPSLVSEGGRPEIIHFMEVRGLELGFRERLDLGERLGFRAERLPVCLKETFQGHPGHSSQMK
jgi:hypothetical protein